MSFNQCSAPPDPRTEIDRMAEKPAKHYCRHDTSVAFVRLVMEFIDAEGDMVRTETWTIGRTAGCALGAWRRANPLMAESLVEHAVVIAGRNRVTYEGLKPIGPRVPVRDVSLEKAAVGL